MGCGNGKINIHKEIGALKYERLEGSSTPSIPSSCHLRANRAAFFFHSLFLLQVFEPDIGDAITANQAAAIQILSVATLALPLVQYWDWSLWSSDGSGDGDYNDFYDLDDVDGDGGLTGWVGGGWSGGCLYVLRIALWPASLANQLRSACTWPQYQATYDDISNKDDLDDDADGFWDTSHGQLQAQKRLEVELAAGVALVVLGVSFQEETKIEPSYFLCHFHFRCDVFALFSCPSFDSRAYIYFVDF